MTLQQHDTLLAAEYVLGVVDEQTRQALDRRFAEDKAFAQQVVRWQKAFSGPDITLQPVTPDPAVWQRVEASLNQNAGTRRVAPACRHPTAWLGWALAATFACINVVMFAMKFPSVSAPQPIAVLNGAQPNQQFVVSFDKTASAIQVSALNVTLPQTKSLQLWLIKGSAPPQSLGLIAHNLSNAFSVPANTLETGTVLAISLEPAGGSRLAGPSGPVIFQGKVSLS